MCDDGNIQNQDFRVPPQHGQLLLHPAADQFGALIQDNIIARESWHAVTVSGRGWLELIEEARQELVHLARDYSRRWRSDDSLPATEGNRAIVLSGHQPNLVHPGVWFKNFLISSLAESHNAIAINLLIDNDTSDGSSIKVPALADQSSQLVSVPIEQLDQDLPYEEWHVQDQQHFTSFAERVGEAGSEWLDQPLLPGLWKDIVQGLEETQNVGQLLSRGRYRLEAELGLKTLELPLSEICRSDLFRLFSAMLIEQAEHFQEIHNSSLAQYRETHRIRSRSHPFPDLVQEESWWEIPFWLWTADNPKRRRAFARVEKDGIIIGDRASTQFSLPGLPARHEQDLLAAFERAEQEGIRVRPRALVTTMYIRLVLGDTFVHGVGGARYDQLTDVIIERFFGLPAPHYIVASATLLLPLSLPPVSDQHVDQARQQLRDSEFSPDVFLSALLEDNQVSDETQIGLIRSLIESKQQHVRQQISPADRPAWHQQLQAINQQLSSYADPFRDSLREQLAELVRQHAQKAALSSREFSFCLFPAETLFSQLLEFVGKAP